MSPERSLKSYLRSLGPGLITGASDNDPAGISTYAVTGARTGYTLLWLCLLTIPLMIVVQDAAARIGAVCEKGLGAKIGETYGRRWFFVVLAALVIMNILTIGADLAGIAAGISLVTHISYRWFIVPTAVFIVLVEVLWSYRKFARYMKYLTLVLFAYVIDGFIARADWVQVLKHSFIPNITWNRETLAIAVGMLGTTISPYLFFWQASEEVEEVQQEEKRGVRKPGQTVKSESLRLFDTAVGMVYSNMVAFFIILSAGATLHQHGIRIETAEEAARALIPIAGHGAYLLFAVGIIGSGLLAIPVLAGATAYPLTEWRGCPEGLDRPVYVARCFYSIIAISVLVGAIIAHLPINPINALFYSQVLMGMLTPIILVMLVMLASNKSVMGDRYVTSKSFQFFGWLSVAVMALADIGLIWTLIA